jgi:DNA-binding MarR family transcriptional regulator
VTTKPAPLTELEQAAWRSLAKLIVLLPRAIDDDLARRSDLTLTRYVVLMRLSEAPGRTLRMGDLAFGATLSPSRLTRVVAGLADEGLVTRCTADDDARVALVTLTDAGMSRLEEVWPHHLAGVRELVLDRLSNRDLSDLRRITEKLVAGLESPQKPMGRPA